eukprot:359107_1
MELTEQLLSVSENQNDKTVPSTVEHLQTMRHGKYHKMKTMFICIASILAFIGYLIYGIDKINSSKNNPEIKSKLISAQNYEIPVTLVCNYWPGDNGIIDIDALFYTNVIIGDSMPDHDHERNVVCHQSFNYDDGKYYYYETADPNYTDCTDFISSDYTKALDRSKWTLLNYNKTAGENVYEQCYAIIPPKNKMFNLSLAMEFVFIPTKSKLATYNGAENVVNYIVDAARIRYNAIHPDNIDNWYSTLQTTKGHITRLSEVDTDSAGYPWYITSFGQTSELAISLYTTKSVSNDISNVYDTRLVSDTGSGYSRYYLEQYNLLYSNHSYSNVYIPTFSINIDANVMSLNENGEPELFQTYTIKYQAYTWIDMISGLGGFISAILSVCGILFGIMLNADYIQSICKWNGIAPYPPFDQHFQVRLKRFNKQD